MDEPKRDSSLRRAAGALVDRARLLKAVLQDSRTPWYAKAVAWLTLAYLVSPIDLIPDFIPVIGHLDDLLIVPAGFYLAMRLAPRAVREEHWQAIEAERAAAGQTSATSRK